MTPGNYDFPAIYRGTKWGPYVFTLTDENDDPVDLTGFSVDSEASAHPEGCHAFDFAPEITDAAAGEITYEFTDEETRNLPVGQFGWDLILENASGERIGPYVAGAIPVIQPRSRP